MDSGSGSTSFPPSATSAGIHGLPNTLHDEVADHGFRGCDFVSARNNGGFTRRVADRSNGGR